MRMHGDMFIGHVFLASPFPLFLSALEALLGTFGTLWGACVSFLIPLLGKQAQRSARAAQSWEGF